MLSVYNIKSVLAQWSSAIKSELAQILQFCSYKKKPHFILANALPFYVIHPSAVICMLSNQPTPGHYGLSSLSTEDTDNSII